MTLYFLQLISLRAENTMSFEKPMSAKQFQNGNGQEVITDPAAAIKAVLSDENCAAILDKMKENQGTGEPVWHDVTVNTKNVSKESLIATAMWQEYVKVFHEYNVRLENLRSPGGYRITIRAK